MTEPVASPSLIPTWPSVQAGAHRKALRIGTSPGGGGTRVGFHPSAQLARPGNVQRGVPFGIRTRKEVRAGEAACVSPPRPSVRCAGNIATLICAEPTPSHFCAGACLGAHTRRSRRWGAPVPPRVLGPRSVCSSPRRPQPARLPTHSRWRYQHGHRHTGHRQHARGRADKTHGRYSKGAGLPSGRGEVFHMRDTQHVGTRDYTRERCRLGSGTWDRRGAQACGTREVSWIPGCLYEVGVPRRWGPGGLEAVVMARRGGLRVRVSLLGPHDFTFS